MGKFVIGKSVLIHGFAYTIPAAIIYAVMMPSMKSDEEKRKILTERYGDNVRNAQGNRQNMKDFFDKIKAGDQDTEDKLNEVFHAGKKKVVRHYYVDDDHSERKGDNHTK
uniref:Uncharacterized protein n=1 Tax=Octactis speculum TaxID=3111310 RepID=A0A7S2AMN0_9STRA|mmetsp:Transcript_12702/g.16797  ORF Transcript_12702/g.16797 Transcript_12702/m.16797 type:complete len:110 (+) Transcript_12702:81-410(+)|eukprot:CAMPEP_0185781578 /NCGR_PEP_ID=MMETSP1174-20130828/102966_1 /TAXON_ID=35687 /ORGANISM="Dictyocha speculum, Strain CCMP1381" /LENGTH=109 /DNA_ID=CAMNT_0028471627 /DNA_START=75 /DNA_END=404 /DNA_ORIENTATION=-